LSFNFHKMYLNHIALTVSNSEEIENFYVDILEFNLKRKFLMDAGISSKFFGINKKIEKEIVNKTYIRQTNLIFGKDVKYSKNTGNSFNRNTFCLRFAKK
jgi:catechol 2,3-dioxygenase-like lactoylglutathione lyase family enzyme